MLGDKVFYCIIGKEFFEFSVQLRCQCLIMCNDKRWFIQLLNDICHRKCLTRTSDTKKGLTLVAFFKTLYKLVNGLWLITGWGVF